MKVAYDIDGLIADEDGRIPDEDDDEAWRRYYLSRKVKFRPKEGGVIIVSGRWKSDYGPTSEWLIRNGIEFSELHLVGGRGVDVVVAKATKLNELGIDLYVNSDYEESVKLSKLTKAYIYAYDLKVLVRNGEIVLNGSLEQAMEYVREIMDFRRRFR